MADLMVEDLHALERARDGLITPGDMFDVGDRCDTLRGLHPPVVHKIVSRLVDRGFIAGDGSLTDAGELARLGRRA